LVPAEDAVEALAACAAAGARNAAILAAGFGEVGSAAKLEEQDRIADIARASGMRVLGPNSEGYHNEIDHVTATFTPAAGLDPEKHFAAAPRRCGIIAQSGGMGFALYRTGRTMGLAFSRLVTTGNETDLTAADFLDHMAGDDVTSVIILFLETARNAA